MQLALMEMSIPPPCFKKSLAFRATIRAWSGWATLQRSVFIFHENAQTRRNLLSEDEVDHVDEHTVLQGLTGILNDGNNVRAAGSHVDKVTAGTMRELDGVDGSGRSNNVGNVGDGCSRGSTKVKGLGTGLDVDGLETTEDTSGKLGSEGVPDSVLGLGGVAVLVLGVLNRNALLVVDALAGGKVGGSQQVFLAATDNEDTLVSMGLLKHIT